MKDSTVYLTAAKVLSREDWLDACAAIAWVAYLRSNRGRMRLIRSFVGLFEDNFSTREERILALLFMHQIHKSEV